MCRWLVYKGTSIPLDVLLTKCRNSLVHQSLHVYSVPYTPGQEPDPRRNHAVSGEGYGVAWYAEGNIHKPTLYKSLMPAWNDMNLRELATIIEADLVFAHVRAGSQGSVSQLNCHPFRCGRFLFMHNGDIWRFTPLGFARVIHALMREDIVRCGIPAGNTDTEYAFGLFMSLLPPKQETEEYTAREIAAALKATCSTILYLTRRLSGEMKCRPSSLNFAVTDGVNICATRFRNGGECPPSLYYALFEEFILPDNSEGMCYLDGVKSQSSMASFPSNSELSSANENAPSSIKNVLSSPALVTDNGDPSELYHKCCIISSEPLTMEEQDWRMVPANSMLIVSGTPKGQCNVVIQPLSLDENGIDDGLSKCIDRLTDLEMLATNWRQAEMKSALSSTCI